jgi:hypothetical protein
MNLRQDMPNLQTLNLADNQIDMFDCRHLMNLVSLYVDRNRLGPFVHEYKIDTLAVLSAEHQEADDPLCVSLD